MAPVNRIQNARGMIMKATRARTGRIWGMVLIFYGAVVLTAQAEDYSYTTNADDTLTLTGYSGLGGDVVIPSNIAAKCVTSIGDLAFFSKSYLSAITIPDSITNIGGSAFAECGKLTNAIIGQNVVAIADDAFYSCTKLRSITVADENPAYSTLDGVLFDKNQERLIRCPGGWTGRYFIPEGVTTIGPWAFNDCNSLPFIQFPDSVTTIEYSAFSCCVSLSSVTIGCGVTQIGGDAFSFCTRLVSLMITGNSLTNLGGNVFQNCWDLQGVYFTSNAPSPDWDSTMFADSHPTIFHLPGTAGWGATFAGRPTAVWQIPIDTPAVQDSGFEFRITGPDSEEAVLEVCTNLAQGVWTPVETNTLLNGFAVFSDPDWTNRPTRYFRIPTRF
jgi:hypothetical protein